MSNEQLFELIKELQEKVEKLEKEVDHLKSFVPKDAGRMGA